MSKGLDALNEIVNEACGNTALLDDNQIIERASIIEKELKEYEKMKRVKGTTTLDGALEETLIKACPNVAKKLKALEIINNKGIDIAFLKAQNTLYSYNQWASCHPNNMYGREKLTEEEWDFVKEVLL